MSLTRKCVVSTCSTRSENGKGMHSFPANSGSRILWQNLCRVEKVTAATRICRIHFKESDYQPYFNDSETRRLKLGVLPSKFMPENLKITVNDTNDLGLGLSCIENNVGVSYIEDSLIPSGGTKISETLIVSNDNGHDYASSTHSNLYEKYHKLFSENAKLSMENHRLKEENEKLSSELDILKAHIKRIESGDNLPKKMVQKVCYEALSKGQFGYTPTQVKLMIQKKQEYKNKKLKYRPQKWSDPELVKVCTYMTKSLNFDLLY